MVLSTPPVALLYERLAAAAGDLNWWPADGQGPNQGRDEIIVGAILVQNTAWANVELALANLKQAGLMALRDLALAEPETIAALIRPSGTFQVKTRRLRAAAHFFAPHGAERWQELNEMPDATLRAALLQVHGIGRETADAIMLYALGRLTFVMDAYTLRIGVRHGLFAPDTQYEQARTFFMRHAHASQAYYNQYHALMVWVGSRFCRPIPRCTQCPLANRDCFASQAAWQARPILNINRPTRPTKARLHNQGVRQ